MLKLLDLFSGIGGFSLGMEATNRIKTIAFVEKDKFCQKVLNKNFKNIPIEEDIRNVKGSNYTADIVSGGFPCQPFSVAGKRRGKDDDRYLWDETIRVVAETKPKYFVGENVEGIINISNGTVLQQIQQDLEKEGFQVQCLVIPASGVGAWHQRKRVWIIAHSNSNRNTNEIARSNGEKKKIQREHRQEDSSAWKFIRTNTNDVPNTNIKGLQGLNNKQQSSQQEQRQFTDKNNENVWNTESTGLQSSSNRQGEGKFWGTSTPGIQCQASWWETQSKLCGIPYGLSARLDKDRTNRIKALGNSIVPLIAYEIGKAIISAEDQSD
jgi:DNA (cytosine-5)-methyltransferase 1